MEQHPTSEGKCFFCGKTFAKASINRHLQGHLKKKVEKSTPGQSYLVKVEPNPKWGYFLSLWVDGSATMQDVDDFLRSIWLECCGHLSAFVNPKNKPTRSDMLNLLAAGVMQRSGKLSECGALLEGQSDILNLLAAGGLLQNGKLSEYGTLPEERSGEVPMSQQTSKVFHGDLKLDYEYDFGSTTRLLLTVMEEYPVKADKKIVLLSRNEPMEWLCDVCQKEPATAICNVHSYDEDCLFCEKCAKKHAKKCKDFADYAALPVVNSPRMGVCCYEGGRIDKQRDGIFVKSSATPRTA
jgi:hypothetical protein